MLVVGEFGHGEAPPWTALSALASVIELPAEVPTPMSLDPDHAIRDSGIPVEHGGIVPRDDQ